MSYDILAFEPSSISDSDFAAWWDDQSQWSEDHTYEDKAVTTPALREFYKELSQSFPPMNGPDAPAAEQIDADHDLEERLATYSIGHSLVYVGFAWAKKPQARELFTSLALKHGVAVAFVSDDGRIIRPTGPEPDEPSTRGLKKSWLSRIANRHTGL